MNIIEEIQDRLSIFKNLYDVIRIVDPIDKKVILIDKNSVTQFTKTCYAFWKKNSFCDNCVSMRAYTHKDTFFKFEYTDKNIFLITATPIEVDGNTYVVELFKKFTEENIMLRGDNSLTYINELVSNINNKMIIDDLTGIYNRRYINERFLTDMNNSVINKYPVSFIMTDIDHFKNINDTYGHIYGDKILKDFASIILKNIRKNTDWVGRYGGEEFLIVLKDIHLDEAYKVAEKIRMELENTTFNYDDTSIRITSSFGVMEVNGANLSLDEVISNVDESLYTAKQNGRNKTCKCEYIPTAIKKV